MPESTEGVLWAIQRVIDEFDQRLEVAFHRFLAAFGLTMIAVVLAFQIAERSLSSVEFVFAVVSGVALVTLGASIRARFYMRMVAVQAEAAAELRQTANELHEEAGRKGDGAAEKAMEAAR
jgi:hypothetical protein